MNNNQEKVKKFIKQNNLRTEIEIRILDLFSEIGELAKEVLVGTSYGKQRFVTTDEITEEIGDAYFSLIEVANTLRIDMDDALTASLSKYEKRIKEKGDPGSK